MKLYFYIMEGMYGDNPKLTYSECEVEKRPKTYKPIDKFPYGYYGSFVRKEDSGCLIGYTKTTCVLEEKDDKRAKEIFASYFEGCIDFKKREIERLEEKLNAVNEFGEI